MSTPKGNIVNRMVPKVFSLFFIALVVFGAYYGWGLYQAYNAGYVVGTKDGKELYKRAIENKWRSLGWNREKQKFLEAHPMKKNPTWKDQLWYQGWHDAIDKETELVPK